MENVEAESSRQKRRREPDIPPPQTVAQVESHGILWEATLQDLIAGKKHNAQICSKDKINLIFSSLDRFESMTWPVSFPMLCLKCLIYDRHHHNHDDHHRRCHHCHHHRHHHHH
jgi:hypothetical protein